VAVVTAMKWQRKAELTNPGLQDEVEVGLGGAAEAGEPRGGGDLAQARLARLCAHRRADRLGQGVGHAQQRREPVVDTPDRIEIVLHPVGGLRLDQQPDAVGSERLSTCAVAPTGSPMSCRLSKVQTRS
jgi:hypothetical protein